MCLCCGRTSNIVDVFRVIVQHNRQRLLKLLLVGLQRSESAVAVVATVFVAAVVTLGCAEWPTLRGKKRDVDPPRVWLLSPQAHHRQPANESTWGVEPRYAGNKGPKKKRRELFGASR